MREPEFIYDIEAMNNIVAVDQLQFQIPDGHFTRGGTDMDHTLQSQPNVK